MADRFRMGLWESRQRIWLDFPYDQAIQDEVKDKIMGVRWSPKNRFWHAPLDLQTGRDAREIARSHGRKLELEPEIVTWIKQEKIRYRNLLKPDDFTADTSLWLPRLRRDRPELVSAMESWPHQVPGTAFMVGQRRVLLADQPGLGKTIQTLAAIAESDVRGPILVVAPRTAVNVTWPEEIMKWLGKHEVIVKINGEMKPAERRAALTTVINLTKNNDSERMWVLCGPNYLRIRADLDSQGNYVRDAQGRKIIRTVNEGLPQLFMIKWASVIVDESHQTLACSTGNKKKQSAQRVGLGALEIDDRGYQIAISGTPFRGKTENLFGTLEWLYPAKHTSYWSWIARHYGLQQSNSRFGYGQVKGDKLRDEKRFFDELRPVMVRRTKREVAPQLPPKMYGGMHLKLATGERDLSEVPSTLSGEAKMEWMAREFGPVAVWLPMSVAQQKQYSEVVDKALITIDAMGSSINVNGALAEMTRLKQLANAGLQSMPNSRSGVGPALPSNKIEWIMNFLVDRVDAGTKVVVASQFTQLINFLSEQLTKHGMGHYVLTGKTDDDERAFIKQEFQKPEGEMVILLNTKAGGVSLTLDLADDVVVVDQTWIPDEQEQVEDRAHRLSRMHNVTIWNLASLGTIDEDVSVTNSEREDAIMGVLDRQRGITYVKTLLEKTRQRQKGSAA